MVRQSTGRSQKLIYIDPEKFLELVAHSEKTERELCASAGISKAVFDRLIRYGGPVQLSTLTRITTALRVSVTSLVDQRRRQ
jgi:DNA-binding Xre family transcriptional regulator